MARRSGNYHPLGLPGVAPKKIKYVRVGTVPVEVTRAVGTRDTLTNHCDGYLTRVANLATRWSPS